MMYEFKMYSPCCKWYLEIQTDCSLAAKLIVKLYGGFIVQEQPHRDDLSFLGIIIKKRRYGYVMMGKSKEYQIKDLNGLAFYLYAVIDKLIEGNMDERYCVLHGGVIAKDKTAYCVIAPTMTGKSTFVAYFALNGYRYLADDYIFFDRETYTIMPLPLPVSLRNTTALGSLLENTYTVSGYNELRGEENTLVSLYKNQETPYSINRILFIRRGKNNTLQSLNKGELYKSMLFNLKNALNIGREQITIGGLINSICGYELSYGDFEYAAECMESI